MLKRTYYKHTVIGKIIAQETTVIVGSVTSKELDWIHERKKIGKEKY